MGTIAVWDTCLEDRVLSDAILVKTGYFFSCGALVPGEGSSRHRVPHPQRKPWSGWGILPAIQASYLRYCHWCYVEIAELVRRKAYRDTCMCREVLITKGRSKIHFWVFFCAVLLILSLDSLRYLPQSSLSPVVLRTCVAPTRSGRFRPFFQRSALWTELSPVQ